MTIFTHSYLEEPLSVEPGSNYRICIEHPKLLYAFVESLVQANEELLSLSKDEKDLDFEKSTLVITDPFLLNPNQKKLLTALYKLAPKRFLNDERRLKLSQIESEIDDLLEDIGKDMSQPVAFDHSIGIDKLMSMVNFAIADEGVTFLERLIGYIKSVQESSALLMVIGINLFQLLDEEEIGLFLTEMESLGLTYIDIEGKNVDAVSKNIQSITIDRDLCEF